VNRDAKRRGVREVKLAANVKDAGLPDPAARDLEGAISQLQRVARRTPRDIPSQKNLRDTPSSIPRRWIDELARYRAGRRANSGR